MFMSYDANTTTETMCEVFSEFGFPDNIHNGRGRNFLSEHFTQFLNTLGIDLTYYSAYHHSSNPAEQAIRNVKKFNEMLCFCRQTLVYCSARIFINTLWEQDYPHQQWWWVENSEDFYLSFLIFFQILPKSNLYYGMRNKFILVVMIYKTYQLVVM